MNFGNNLSILTDNQERFRQKKMKLKDFTLCTILFLISSVAFSQDSGNPDSLKIVVSSPALQVGLPSQPLTVACSVFIDANELTTLQFAFQWDNADLVLDSADTEGASQQFKNMEVGPFYYLDDNVLTSIDSNIAICSGTSIDSNFSSSLSWQFLATYHFTVLNWSAASGAINIDTVQLPGNAATEYIFVPTPIVSQDYDPVWKGPINISPTGIKDSDPNNIPASFELAQNFPNPFNPTTSIKFGLPAKSHANIKVYNLLGQEIAILVDQELPAGTYTAEWDGRDKNNTEVASGIYFYKLVAGDFIDTKKMMLVK